MLNRCFLCGHRSDLILIRSSCFLLIGRVTLSIYSYSIIAPVPDTLMAVSVDVARQLWCGQTRMTSVLYRSRLDNGAEVLLHRRQDSECSLAYFYIAATLMLKK